MAALLPVLEADLASIAADLQVHYTYVPSGCNPADAPSRGVSRKGQRRSGSRVLKHPVMLKDTEREYRDWKRSLRKLACWRAGAF